MENWKDIKGYEGYYMVSDLGNVKSLERKVMTYQGLKTRKERILKPYLTHGYARICLHKEGDKKMVNIHRLVCEAFLPSINGKEIVNHKDGNRSNNVLSNLEWCTQSENIKHKFSHNKYIVSWASLKEWQVEYIRSFDKKYGICVKLAKELCVPIYTVRRVMNGETYKNI
jgi:hypothetical protein